MKFRIPSLIVGLLMASISTFANAETPLEVTFKAFSKCDNSFFAEMGNNAEAMQQLAPVKSKGPFSWFEVKNRRDDSANQSKLPESALVGNIPVLGYQDQATLLGGDGNYYFWGFRMRGTPKDVLEATRPFLHESKQIQLNGTVYVRSEVSVLDSPFRISKPVTGIPKSFSTERVLLIEEDAADAIGPVTKVFCSLQGYLSRKKLEDIRPDLSVADYPTQLDPTLFGKTAVTPQALKDAQALLATHAFLQPKFKKIKYSTKAAGGNNNFTVEALPNGLVHVRENYTIFEVERESLAGLFQLKSMMYNIGSGEVTLTEKLGMTLSAQWAPESKLVYTQHMVNSDAKNKDAIGRYVWNCTVGESFDANIIHANLTGRAIPLVCETNSYRVFGAVDNKSSESHPVFLEDLGVFLPQFRRVGLFKIHNPSYATFEIER